MHQTLYHGERTPARRDLHPLTVWAIIFLIGVIIQACGPDEGGQDAFARAANGTPVSLAWDVVVRDGDEPIASYTLWRGKTCRSLASVVEGLVDHGYTDLVPHHFNTVCYQVQAVSTTGLTARSNTLSLVP